jgi:hypothetical protein
MVKKSLLRPILGNNMTIPNTLAPSTGDVVQYNSTWEGRLQIGNIRNLQYDKAKEQWTADVIPLKEGKANNIFIFNRDAKLEVVPINELQPVKAYFVRSENGYNVTTRVNSSEVVLRGVRYRELEATYKIPKKVVLIDVIRVIQ